MAEERNEKGVKAVSQFLRRNFYLVMAGVSVAFVCWMLIYYWEDLACLMVAGINDWEDGRNIGLFIGGTAAPIVAFLGLHLSNGRLVEQSKQTTQMIRQNDAQMSANNQKLFIDALGFLDSNETHKRMAGLTTFRNRSFALNDSYFHSASTFLIQFIEANKSSLPNEERERVNPDGKRIFISSSKPESVRFDLVQEGFRSLLFLENERISEGYSERSKRYRFHNLHVARMDLADTGEMKNFMFAICNLSMMSFNGVRLSDVTFHGCDLKHTKFRKSRFSNCLFIGCEIDGADFATAEWSGDWIHLRSCKYERGNPPLVRPGTCIPTPMNDVGAQMTADEAIAIMGNDKYKSADPIIPRATSLIYIGPPHNDEMHY